MIFAYVIGVIGVLAFLDTLGVWGDIFHYLWASAVVVAGIVYIVYPSFKANRLFGGILATAGIAELVSIMSALLIFQFVWPATLAGLGLLLRTKRRLGFLPDRVFNQRQDRLVGGSLVLSGAMRLINVASGSNMGTVGWGWILFLLIASIALVLTSEHL